MIITDTINIALGKFIDLGKLYPFFNRMEINKKLNKNLQRNKCLLIKLN